MNSLSCAPFSRAAFAAFFSAAVMLVLAAPHRAQAQDAADATPAAPAPAEPAPPQTYDQAVPVAPETAAPAEEPASAGAVKLEKVEVTGSRIKRQDYETAQPVAVIKREDIARTGLTNIGDLLAQITTAGTSINTKVGTIALTGNETNLDFRNLGTNRVLILVDGHRWVNGLSSTSTSAVDLNTIPTAIIERIEVLKDGASAIYGSDAIAGVVNIITRKNYSGVELSSQVGEFDKGDGTTQQHQISFGHVSGATSLFANFSYTREERVITNSRDISAYQTLGAGRTRWSTLGPEGRFTFIPTPVNAVVMGTDRCPNLLGNTTDLTSTPTDPNPGPPVPGGLPIVPGIPLPLPGPVAGAVNSVPTGVALCSVAHNPGTPGTTPLDYHALTDADKVDRFVNTNSQNPSKRYGLFFQLNQKLTDAISFNFQGLYNHRAAESALGYSLIQAGDLAGSPIYISATQRYNPFHQDIGKGTPSADQSPIGAGVGSGLFGIRNFNDPRVDFFSNDTIRLGGAFNGAFSIWSQFFSWDLGYSYSTNAKKEFGNTQGIFRQDRLALALGPAANCTGDCIPLNIFQGQSGITKQMWDYIEAFTTNHTRTRQDDAYLNVSTDLGPVHLPAGPIAVALGGEYRRDLYRDNPDDLFVRGLTFGNNAQPTSGQNTAREAYLEFSVPLISDLPLVKMIDLSLAGRFSKYALSGNATTGKAGLRWRVYDDLLLRGTYSSAFRAPSTGELFLGDTISFDFTSDPCAANRNNPTTNANCNADNVPANVTKNDQTQAVLGGNLQLKPEKARTLTYGLVFSPTFLGDMNINVDYYRIAVDKFISVPGSQFILDSCYNSTQRSFCQFVHRGSNGVLTLIEDRYVNFSALNTSGIDSGIDYTLPIPATFGRNKITLDASYLMQYDSLIPVPGGGAQISPPQPGQSYNFTAVPRWKATGEYLFKMGGLSFSWTTRMIFHKNEGCVDGRAPSLAELGLCSNPKFVTNADGTVTDISENTLKTIFYHNVQLGYEFSGPKVELAGGVNNVLNQDPPISRDPSFGGAFFNYDILSYETPGRFFYVKAGLKF